MFDFTDTSHRNLKLSIALIHGCLESTPPAHSLAFASFPPLLPSHHFTILENIVMVMHSPDYATSFPK